ncbi:SUMF1/EgtB/PvdO family nonheme iron enzyme [Bosea sp. BIWAKO-01]|uniref:formylglycine-generating enzyme family protein n=1 Tax=Bosea sp. BIWAKO-01 TaxID=506668 RepID=UPI0008535770|nr:SUMF1/EgtB/PvdO family nonheme iron enzyme [Bosea sp. BIWAKO-01]GAU81699.1 nitrite reductase accessory protein NirV [Bosea sp. BIWAKO-01]
MLSAFKLMALATAALAPIAISALAPGYGTGPATPHVPLPEFVELRPGTIQFRASGEFLGGGKPIVAPIVAVTVDRSLAVMKSQVTVADYQRCVKAGACPVAGSGETASNRPVVGVSWRDTQAYISWLSRETGTRFRLPTDEEWAYAAASRFHDDALPESLDRSDPGQRALAIYDRDASRVMAAGKAPQPIGSFGANENGLLDMAGNVWEWTDTCFQRITLDAAGATTAAVANCGVRVVEGLHRAYMTDFVRDARAGGCVSGTPPSNLGFRLVRDDVSWPGLSLALGLVRPAAR